MNIGEYCPSLMQKLKYEKWHSGSYKDDQDQQLNTRIYCMNFYKGLNREIFITI
jgi:hypothetical protein